MLYESDNTEFKSQYTEGIYKSVIAFANAGGGTIYVGMNDDGTVIGLDGDVFECMRSVNQDLTFDETSDAFARRKMDFGTDKFPALGLVNLHDGQYTNLAALMSDQCRHTIKVAVFQDEEKTIFRDTREFTGSVLRQLEDVYEYLHLCNRTAGVIQGLVRREQSDYPEEALREALLNAIIHRDYSFSGSTIINVNDTCMEFISLGGLLQGLTVDDIRSGISLPRNRNLAAIFHRLQLIEAYGTGIRRIYSLYQSSPAQPQIIVTPNVFKLILPNTNAAAVNSGINFLSEPEISYGEHIEQKPAMTAQMRTVMQYLSEKGEISTEGLQELLDVKQTRAYVIARQMQDAGYIESTGRGAGKRYRLK